MSVCGRARPLGLFEILTRNRQSALELSGRSRSAQEQPPRMCTIPPRQQLSSPTWLAIRRWRVARARIRNRNRNRNRNRIITRVLQPPHPCKTKRERERGTKHPMHTFPKQKKCKGEREKNSPSTNSSSLSFVAVRVVIFLYHARHHKYTHHLSLSLSHRRVVFAGVLSFSLLSPKKTNRRVSAFF